MNLLSFLQVAIPRGGFDPLTESEENEAIFREMPNQEVDPPHAREDWLRGEYRTTEIPAFVEEAEWRNQGYTVKVLKNRNEPVNLFTDMDFSDKAPYAETKKYFCSNCGDVSVGWREYCPACKKYVAHFEGDGQDPNFDQWEACPHCRERSATWRSHCPSCGREKEDISPFQRHMRRYVYHLRERQAILGTDMRYTETSVLRRLIAKKDVLYGLLCSLVAAGYALYMFLR